MALGEWLSVQSSRELYERQIRIESRDVEDVPDEEEEELALIYQAKGFDWWIKRGGSDRIQSILLFIRF